MPYPVIHTSVHGLHSTSLSGGWLRAWSHRALHSLHRYLLQHLHIQIGFGTVLPFGIFGSPCLTVPAAFASLMHLAHHPFSYQYVSGLCVAVHVFTTVAAFTSCSPSHLAAGGGLGRGTLCRLGTK